MNSAEILSVDFYKESTKIHHISLDYVLLAALIRVQVSPNQAFLGERRVLATTVEQVVKSVAYIVSLGNEMNIALQHRAQPMNRTP